jgi:hypothetical protein
MGGVDWVERVVVTVPDDPGVVGGKRVGGLFNAAWSKYWMLREALGGEEGVRAVLHDADMVLSEVLLARVRRAVEVCGDRAVLLGLAGRRICREVPRRGLVPRWYLERHEGVIGYFQVDQGSRLGRWEGGGEWGEAHEDWVFAMGYGEGNCVALPFASHHVGGVSRHWSGYEGRLEAGGDSGEGKVVGAGEWFGEALCGRVVVVLGVYGPEDAVGLAGVVGVGGEVLVVDRWELDQGKVERVEDLPEWLCGIAGWRAGAWRRCREAWWRGEAAPSLEESVVPLFLELIEADRRLTRERFEEGVRGVSGGVVRILGEGGSDPLEDGVVREGVDGLWIGGEIGYGVVMREVPRWRRKMRGCEGVICGAFYDVVNWPESTAAVGMLLGTPEVVAVDGQWLKRSPGRAGDGAGYPRGLPLDDAELEGVAGGAGVVFCQESRAGDVLERLMVSLHSVREHWAGEVVVLYSGAESPAVRVACARYGAWYREVPGPDEEDEGEEDRARVDVERMVRDWSPFGRTLWIETGVIGNGKQIGKWARRVGDGRKGVRGTVKEVEVLRLRRGMEGRSEGERVRLEREVMRAWAVTVRVRWDAAVVTGLLRDDLDGFGRNWMATSWRYGAAVLEEEWRVRVPVPVYVGLCEVGAAEVGAAMVEGPDGSCAVVTLMPVAGWPGPDAGEPYWTAALGAAAVRAETEWLIYVDPMMHPSSGAELFLGHRMRGGEETDVYAPGWAFRRIGVEESEWIGRVFGGDGLEGGAVPVPEELELGRLMRHVRLGPPATMVRREVMKDVLAEWLAMAGDMPFEVFLTLRLWREAVRRGGSVRMTRHTGAGVEVCRPVEWGWRL